MQCLYFAVALRRFYKYKYNYLIALQFTSTNLLISTFASLYFVSTGTCTYVQVPVLTSASAFRGLNKALLCKVCKCIQIFIKQSFVQDLQDILNAPLQIFNLYKPLVMHVRASASANQTLFCTYVQIAKRFVSTCKIASGNKPPSGWPTKGQC